MATDLKARLSCLRDFGWSLWDPIGLTAIEGAWRESPNADEYDNYLLHAADLLQEGAEEEECVQYLEEIESEYMGLGVRADAHHRAIRTIRAISQYLASVQDRPATLQ